MRGVALRSGAQESRKIGRQDKISSDPSDPAFLPSCVPSQKKPHAPSRRPRLAALAYRLKGAALKGLVVSLLIGCSSQPSQAPAASATAVRAQSQYDTLPPKAAEKLKASFTAAAAHQNQLWRDTPLFNQDGTVNGYVEIPMGDLTKYEFDMATNERAVDRVLPDDLVGYPINYGFFPQTVGYDGDPYDVLVLGPPLPGGAFVKGKVVGLMYMDDEKGADMKTVISPVDDKGEAIYPLTTADKARVGDWFNGYKKWEAAKGKWAKVTGWGDATEGRQFLDRTHRFFEQGR